MARGRGQLPAPLPDERRPRFVGDIPGGKTKKVKIKLERHGSIEAFFNLNSDNAGGKTVKKITVRK